MQRKPSLPRPFYVKKSRRGILLLHAYSGSPNDVRMLCRLLEKHQYTVSAPMLTGHGTMEPLEIVQVSVQQWREDVSDALATLAQDCDQVAVFGLSMGGILAMDALAQATLPLLGGGVFCSPLFKNENNVPENFLKYAQQVYQVAELPTEERQQRLTKVKELQQQQMQGIEELGAEVATKLQQLRVPVYIAQGGKDELISAATAFQTLEALQQTDVSFHWFAESGHVITVDPVHQQFEQTVLDFIDNLPWNEEK